MFQVATSGVGCRRFGNCVRLCVRGAHRGPRRDLPRRRRPHIDRLVHGSEQPAGAGRHPGANAGRSKDDWQGLAQRLVEANINAFAIDLPALSLPADSRALLAWHEGILAAVALLASRPADVRPGFVGLAGASLGANLAVIAAASDASVRSIALISPSIEYRGVHIDASLRRYGARPALLIASLHDPYAARSVRELARDAPGPREVRWSSVPAHGTSLLSGDPDLVRSLVEWFQQTLE